MAKTFAILISNGNYPNWGDSGEGLDPTIPNAEASHNELRKLLMDDHYFGSKEFPVQISDLKNEDSDVIKKTIQRITKSCKPEDSLYLYYVGHGIKQTDGNLYLTAADTDHSLVESSAVSSFDVKRYLDDCQAMKKIVILDCCYAGTFLDETQGLSWDTANIKEMRGTFFMFSSPNNRSSKFKRDRADLPTFFTYALTKTISEGDPAAGEYCTTMDIFNHIPEELQWLRQEFQQPDIPEPDKRIFKDAEKFLFCRNRKYEPRLSSEDLELNEIISNPTQDKVRAWQEKFPESLRFDEAMDLLLVLENVETELNTLSSLPATERAPALVEFAKKHSKFKELRKMALDRFDMAKKEARAQLDKVTSERNVTSAPGGINVNAGGETNKVQSPRSA